MQWTRAVIVTLLLSSTTVSQDETQQNGIEALKHNAIQKPDHSKRKLANSKVFNAETFKAFDRLENRLPERNKEAKFFDFGRLPRIIQELQQVAAMRVPPIASDTQRDKLKVAASLDIRHAVSKYCASYAEGGPAKLEQVRKARNGDELDIFGPESLFQKVMRQQGLLE